MKAIRKSRSASVNAKAKEEARNATRARARATKVCLQLLLLCAFLWRATHHDHTRKHPLCLGTGCTQAVATKSPKPLRRESHVTSACFCSCVQFVIDSQNKNAFVTASTPAFAAADTHAFGTADARAFWIADTRAFARAYTACVCTGVRTCVCIGGHTCALHSVPASVWESGHKK